MCEKNQGWWDREFDDRGHQIRSDVRSAAHVVWQRVQRYAEHELGDNAAGELLEQSVVEASRYLNSRGIPLGAQDHVGLLLVTFRRLLRRRCAKIRRLELIGDIGELAARVPDHSWNDIDHWLDLDKIIRLLSQRSRTILALRSAGYEWSEIGKLLGVSAGKLKSDFWREVRQLGRRSFRRE